MRQTVRKIVESQGIDYNRNMRLSNVDNQRAVIETGHGRYSKRTNTGGSKFVCYA